MNLGSDPTNGKRTRKWESGFRTNREAEKRLAELIHQIESGINVQLSRDDFGGVLSEWLESYVATRVRARTLEGYRQRSKQIIDSIGTIRLADLRPNHLANYYNDKSDSLSPGTLIKHNNLIRNCLSHAVKWNLIIRNVAEAVNHRGLERWR